MTVRQCIAVVSALLIAFTGCGGNSTPAATARAAPTVLRIAAASDLKVALPEILAEFEKLHPDLKTEAVYGASGKLYAQIAEQAPFHVFLSADVDYPRKLAASGKADPDSLTVYAIGHVVLWCPNASPLEPATTGIDTLRDPRVRKIAIANPRHAPYGRAAQAALKHFQIEDELAPKLVFAENVAQAAQFVETGAADVGLISLSLALSPALKKSGKHWPLPADSHPSLEQAGVAISHPETLDHARAFLKFLRSKASTAVLKQHGFDIPGA